MLKPPSNSRQIYSVTKLNRYVKSLLEAEVGNVWLSAEISNFTAAASGHWYFTLKDSKAQIKSAMFRGANARLKYRPKEGDKVLVRGNLSLYEPRGDYQLIADYMELDGSGDLQAAFEALKAKLNSLGLFAAERKRQIPDIVNTVGVVTSATGAALHDILTVLRRRSPATKVIVYPTQVQGVEAHQHIINAITVANRRSEVDVLIVGRGGGSIEDLWCFNHEQLAYAIAESTLPIISAVGHEVDITIADYVADLRAPTPSAAAEVVSRDVRHQLQAIDTLHRALRQHMRRHLEQAAYRLKTAANGVQRNHPQSKLITQSQRLDEIAARLANAVKRQNNQTQQYLSQLAQRLIRVSPKREIYQHQQRLGQVHMRLQSVVVHRLQKHRQRLAEQAGLLQSLSPLATLSRGYSITQSNCEVVVSSKQVQIGDEIRTQLHDGALVSQVTEIGKS
ncbi:exodeoxyribonuclease VII large subunit [Alteromonas sp. ASW11-36]|uniref:Exodeoxyribonuclease 7 large subunit n=1 Tax=Alteromonas arenosi TaxID=3055817 RepID=A0ABT7SU30_9ALTE|nr:exodeoxyribonuclease VII large subunit [Alteromonas sp. ASW11-36]MDM7859704.1 exodeoxyribonuclease VII large subunit [Alteromonas sp. ASW11-36]